MKNISALMTCLMFSLVVHAQQNDPEDMDAVDKPAAPHAPAIVADTAEKVYTVVEVVPEYPGGFSALVAFLNTNIHYPDEARKNHIQGKVLVKFIVGKAGEIIDAKIFRSVDPAIDAEAIRVVRAMPRWKPGRQNGSPVKVYYVLPISFKLAQ